MISCTAILNPSPKMSQQKAYSYARGSILYGCKNYKSQKDSKSFFRMPKDSQRLKKWIEACKRSDLESLLEVKDADYFNKNYVVCSDHFDIKCFRNKDLYSQGLLPNSVPTLAFCNATKVPLEYKSQCEKNIMECARKVAMSPAELKNQEPDVKSEEEIRKDAEYVLQNKVSNGGSQKKAEIINKLMTWAHQQSSPSQSRLVNKGSASEHGHSSEPSTSRLSIESTQSKYSLYTCLECKQNIVDARFACVQCESYDVCVRCAASDVHEDHYLLRVPKYSTQEETQVVLQAVRAQLKALIPENIKQKNIRMGEDTIGESADAIKEEVNTIGKSADAIKEEVDTIGESADAIKEEVDTIGEGVEVVEFDVTVKDEPIEVHSFAQYVQVEYSSMVEAECPAEDICMVKSEPQIDDGYCDGNGDPKSKRARLSDNDKCQLPSTAHKLEQEVDKLLMSVTNKRTREEILSAKRRASKLRYDRIKSDPVLYQLRKNKIKATYLRNKKEQVTEIEMKSVVEQHKQEDKLLMSNTKKTREEILSAKRRASKLRYERIKSDPVLYQLRKNKDKADYLRRKENKQVTEIEMKSVVEQHKQRQKWRQNSEVYYLRKKKQKEMHHISINENVDGDKPVVAAETYETDPLEVQQGKESHQLTEVEN